MDICDKEFLVTPALGLYCELLVQEQEGMLSTDKKEVLDFFKEHEHEVFPPTMAFSLPGGQSETRELFGDILQVLHTLDLKSAGFGNKAQESEDATWTAPKVVAIKRLDGSSTDRASCTKKLRGSVKLLDASTSDRSNSFDNFKDMSNGKGTPAVADEQMNGNILVRILTICLFYIFRQAERWSIRVCPSGC